MKTCVCFLCGYRSGGACARVGVCVRVYDVQYEYDGGAMCDIIVLCHAYAEFMCV